MDDTQGEDGWVVKAPYETNSQIIKFCKTKAAVAATLKSLSISLSGCIPYLMVQPCLVNRTEYKVVLLAGVAAYVASINQKGHGFNNKSFSKSPHTAIKRFAESAVKMLQINNPHSICGGLVRVDIMMNACGDLVVNEFESLEAAIYSSNPTLEFKARMWLVKYWKTVLKQCVGVSRTV
jgi:hypothetical protein